MEIISLLFIPFRVLCYVLYVCFFIQVNLKNAKAINGTKYIDSIWLVCKLLYMNLSIFEISVLGVCGGLSLQTVFRAKSNRVVVHVEHGFPL
jgi:hypothetical protein